MPRIHLQEWREACNVAGDAAESLRQVLLDLGTPPDVAQRVQGMPTVGAAPMVSVPEPLPAHVVEALAEAARRGMS